MSRFSANQSRNFLIIINFAAKNKTKTAAGGEPSSSGSPLLALAITEVLADLIVWQQRGADAHTQRLRSLVFSSSRRRAASTGGAQKDTAPTASQKHIKKHQKPAFFKYENRENLLSGSSLNLEL